jgi:hypothetical protein
MKRTAVLPDGWTSVGVLPEVDLVSSEPTPDQLHSLTEDIWQARSAGGRYTLDVGWYPDLDPSGRFVCLVVQDENWEEPIERFETRSATAVVTWVRAIVPRYAAQQ